MEKQILTLKQKLLNTNCFICNEHLNAYCELIVNNLTTKKEKYKTQIHHIIPKCYYNANSLDIDNSKTNLVNLFYKDHILTHYYLCMCAEGEIKYKLVNAFFHLTSRKWKLEDFDPEVDLENYQILYEEWCKNLNPMRKWENFEDVIARISKDNLYNYYIIEGHSKKETHSHFNISDSRLDALLRYYNIYKFMPRELIKKKFKELDSKLEELKCLYFEKLYTK